jgi:fructose-1,6-bisphosphatase I
MQLFQSSDPLAPPSPIKFKPRKKKLKTFNRYLEVECWKRTELRELERVFVAVSDACKQINRIVQRAQTDDLYGVALGTDGKPVEETNVQGEVQQQLDVLCNTIMLRAFCGCSNAICAVASEEEDDSRSCADVMVSILFVLRWLQPLHILLTTYYQNDSAFAIGDYVAVFDPLDGSKNIDASLPVGSIFGIYKKQPGVDGSTFLQDGSGLVAAGYCLFS